MISVNIIKMKREMSLFMQPRMAKGTLNVKRMFEAEYKYIHI